MSPATRQTGIALLAVLWVISGLSVVAATVLAQTRTDIELTRTHLELAKARSMAEAGVYRGIYELLRTRETVRFGLPETMPRIEQRDAMVTVRIDNEAGKVDVNTADEALLRNLFEQAGASAAAAGRLARRTGARDSMGVASESSRTAREFVSIEAFAAGLGLSRNMWVTLAPWITVHNGQTGINPWVADEAVLSLVPGYSPSLLENPADMGAPDRLQSRFMQPDHPYFTERLSAVYTITARARAGGASTRVEAMVKMSANRNQPYTILAWREVPRFPGG